MASAAPDARALRDFEAVEAERLRRAIRKPAATANRAEDMIVRFEALDRALVARGFPATSPWWMEQVRRYFRSGRRQVVWRVGRRGGKSTTLCRIGVVEALCGGHRIPPGDIGIVAIISLSRTEASERLRTIRAILDALGIKHHPIDGGLELDERPVGFRVHAASIAGVSGFTAICVICDEVAKWRDADTGANPAKEVLASVRPTMATQPLAKIVLSSSPLGHLDAHAAAYDVGDDELQIVAWAPTWVANPTITEDDTRQLERDDAKRKREYGAVPLEGDDEGMFTAAMLDAVTRPERDLPREKGVTYLAAMDPAFTRNAWTLVIAGQRFVGARVRRSIVCVREWRGSMGQALNPEAVLREIAAICRSYGVAGVYSDRYERFGISNIADRDDIKLAVTVPERTASQILAEYEEIETRIVDGEVEMHPDARLRSDFLSVRRKLTANGFSVQLPTTADGRHCDYAPSAVLALSRCTMPPVPQPRELSIEEKIAGLRLAEEARWKEVERRGDANAVRRQDRSWLEELEEMTYGQG